MRELQINEQDFISGGLMGSSDVTQWSPATGSTQTFDDGSVLITNSGGGLIGAIGTDGGWYSAHEGGTPQIPTWASGLLPPVFGALAEAWNGLGQYNSAAGPGPGGTQNLPDVPPVIAP